jgi:hypothetical protein
MPGLLQFIDITSNAPEPDNNVMEADSELLEYSKELAMSGKLWKKGHWSPASGLEPVVYDC